MLILNSSKSGFGGKLFVDWDQDAEVTPQGQLSFFINFLKLGARFTPWVEQCPLSYHSNNAPSKIDVLGSFVLSILSGHRRYAHLANLQSDRVNAQLLGMGLSANSHKYEIIFSSENFGFLF